MAHPSSLGPQTLAQNPLTAAGRPNLRVERHEGGPWSSLRGCTCGLGRAKVPLCFGDGGGRDSLSVQLAFCSGVGVRVAPGILFAYRTQTSGRLGRRNVF